jgi:hypothetical protein
LMKLNLLICFSNSFPKYDPNPVKSIQLARIIPVTSSFPLYTDMNSLRRIIWVIIEVNPRMKSENLILLSDLINILYICLSISNLNKNVKTNTFMFFPVNIPGNV